MAIQGSTIKTSDTGTTRGVRVDTDGYLETKSVGGTLPTGAATSAKQDTQTTALQAIQTSVETIDNAISGTEMQVDIVAPLPAGTNAIGKLAANSGVDIGDVDILTLPTMSRTGSVTITRPNDTTAYAAGDAIGDVGGSAILEFTNFGAAGEQIILDTVDLEIDVAAIPSGMGTFTFHFYNASPTAIADNAAWDLVSGDRSKYLGSAQIFTPSDLGSTLYSQNNRLGIPVVLAGTSLFAILKTDTAYTPTASAVKKAKVVGFRV